MMYIVWDLLFAYHVHIMLVISYMIIAKKYALFIAYRVIDITLIQIRVCRHKKNNEILSHMANDLYLFKYSEICY